MFKSGNRFPSFDDSLKFVNVQSESEIPFAEICLRTCCDERKSIFYQKLDNYSPRTYFLLYLPYSKTRRYFRASKIHMTHETMLSRYVFDTFFSHDSIILIDPFLINVSVQNFIFLEFIKFRHRTRMFLVIVMGYE